MLFVQYNYKKNGREEKSDKRKAAKEYGRKLRLIFFIYAQ